MSPFRLLPLLLAHWPRLAASQALLLASTGLGLLGPLLVAQALDGAVAQKDVEGLQLLAAILAALLIGQAAMSWMARVGLEIVAQAAMVKLKGRLFDHLVDHDIALHERNPAGTLITRIQGDIDALRTLFTEVILALPSDIALALGVLAAMLWRAPDLAVPVLGVLPPYLLALAIFRLVAPPLMIRIRKLAAELTGFLTEHVRALNTIMLLDQGDWVDARAEVLNRKVVIATFLTALTSSAYFNTVFLVRSLGTVAVLSYGTSRMVQGTATVGDVVLALGYIRLLFGPLMRLSHNLTQFERARSAADRVLDLLDTPRQVKEAESPVAWPGLKKSVQLENVAFHYVEGTPVLHDVSLEFRAGTRVGIVGPTGSGKSTLLDLLLRFRDPVGGAVRLDGVDLRDIATEDLRRHAGLVLQDVQLFDGTVLDNLGGDPVLAQQALDRLGVGLDLERELGEAGSGLSHGERQLITFARALVHDPTLLVLDEATSAIDPETERKIEHALSVLMEGRTTIVVAHRLATVRTCDEIVVLVHGEVLERGSHDVLMERDGVYAKLVRAQAA